MLLITTGRDTALVLTIVTTQSPNCLESVWSKTGLAITAVGLTLAVASNASAATVFGFQDEYAPSNWNTTNSNADGSVNTSQAPTSISLTGGDNGSFAPGNTDYTTTAAATGEVMFDWNYSTFDFGPFFDPFFVLNGTPTQLTDDNGGPIQSGTFMFDVLAGDIFGFRIGTTDNIAGSSTVTISNFEAPAPAVPEPSNILGLITISALGVGTLLKRR